MIWAGEVMGQAVSSAQLQARQRSATWSLLAAGKAGCPASPDSATHSIQYDGRLASVIRHVSPIIWLIPCMNSLIANHTAFWQHLGEELNAPADCMHEAWVANDWLEHQSAAS